jgi:hypothetical protein
MNVTEIANMQSIGLVNVATVTGTLFAVIISFLTLYLTHLKGVDILFSLEEEKTLLDDLEVNDFAGAIPTHFRGKTSFLVLNKGNRTGVLRITDVKFDSVSGFSKFYEVFRPSLHSAKLAPATLTLQMPLTLRDGDAEIIDMDYIIDLNDIIRRGYKYNLNTINIESSNLREVLNDLSNYKKERLKEFIEFLENNAKIGKIEIFYKYTKKRWMKREPFKDGIKSLDVFHKFKEAVKHYKDSFQNFQLDPSPESIIQEVLREVDLLKRILDKCNHDIESHPRRNDLFRFRETQNIDNYFEKIKEEIKLLKKCGNYKNIVETDLEPLLREILEFGRETSVASSLPDGNTREKLIDELTSKRGPLRGRIIMVSFKIDELKKMIEQELEDI